MKRRDFLRAAAASLLAPYVPRLMDHQVVSYATTHISMEWSKATLPEYVLAFASETLPDHMIALFAERLGRVADLVPDPFIIDVQE